MLSMLFTVSDPRHNFPLALDPLPCSVLILSIAKNQSDVENLVKNCLNLFTVIFYIDCFKIVDLGICVMHQSTPSVAFPWG